MKEIVFKIAGFYFRFIYLQDDYLHISGPILAFITDSLPADAQTNYITRIDTSANLSPVGKIRYETPAWTWMDTEGYCIIRFHPDNHYIGYMTFVEGEDVFHTYFTKEDFSPQVLPISMMGFILQQVLNRHRSGLIMHGATIDIQGKGVVLTGNSGVGKSTLSSFMMQERNCRLLTDDRIIVRDESIICAYGNPFDTKIRTSLNEKTVIAAIIFLRHGAANQLTRIDHGQALKELLTISLH